MRHNKKKHHLYFQFMYNTICYSSTLNGAIASSVKMESLPMGSIDMNEHPFSPQLTPQQYEQQMHKHQQIISNLFKRDAN